MSILGKYCNLELLTLTRAKSSTLRWTVRHGKIQGQWAALYFTMSDIVHYTKNWTFQKFTIQSYVDILWSSFCLVGKLQILIFHCLFGEHTVFTQWIQIAKTRQKKVQLMFSQIFPSKFQNIHITSVSGHCTHTWHSKFVKSLWGISITGQF